ncbi:FHA domain-containing protein [Thiohalomonas denitrificans]|uniref:FHA domain-containing protein n=1 Tax=Thiohalomonas denitrificans TaxID=415747 RepID=A0A1G5PKV7_9GAMM|nr:FHA domain-containing protein [Thiohalomonas denitrificans]SCZ50132.1 FHA domain-containing protein [Thiohalomonas denitrificans]
MSAIEEPRRSLVVRLGGVTVREYPLENTRLTIGRRSDNQLQLDDSAVSGVHAEILLEPSPFLEGYREPYLVDIGSTNGTTVNGSRIDRYRLIPGDRIRIGAHELLYQEEGGMDQTVILIPDAED